MLDVERNVAWKAIDVVALVTIIDEGACGLCQHSVSFPRPLLLPAGPAPIWLRGSLS
jgi:hypothetical protein